MRAHLTMLGATGFAVIDNGRDTAHVLQFLLEIGNLVDRNEVVTFPCED